MVDENKSSNIIIIGVVAMFFAYLIYMKSKDTTTPVQQVQPVQQIQPIPIYPPPQPCPTPYPVQSSMDNVELYKIQQQTKQINDTLQSQINQIQNIQNQQLKQAENISQLENEKCSNVVSMGNTSTSQPIQSYNNQYNLMRNLRPTTNVRRENEELVAHRIFGMQ